MSGVTYFDVCDKAFKTSDYPRRIRVLRVAEDGSVYEDTPTPLEYESFCRNLETSGVISKEIAYALAKNPSLSY